ncbi:hypothetical protein LEP1GSC021_0351 [Leptospira noguchii str. 1993005606]|nr:hypothetical protein LEP1GSC021_0351 [Leptospira noguchii str. 1993005606]
MWELTQIRILQKDSDAKLHGNCVIERKNLLKNLNHRTRQNLWELSRFVIND